MRSRIKFIAKFFVAVAVLAAYSSCMDNPCVRGEGAKTKCVTTMHLHVMNATDKEVQIGNLKLQPSESREVISDDYKDITHLMVEYFGGDSAYCAKSVCVAKFVFDGDVVLQHKAFFADSNNRWYYSPSELLPAEHNIFDHKSWQTGFIDDSWRTWGCYTITDEDYQAALQQSDK